MREMFSVFFMEGYVVFKIFTGFVIILFAVWSIWLCSIQANIKKSETKKTVESMEGDKKMSSDQVQRAGENKNVQIQGNNNYVDNRTYTYNTNASSALAYSFSDLRHDSSGKYVRILNMEAKGNIPIYNPLIFLKFNKSVERAEFTGGAGALALFNLRTNSDLATKVLNNSEYFFGVRDLTPGSGIQFIFSNSTEFDIVEFRINDNKVF